MPISFALPSISPALCPALFSIPRTPPAFPLVFPSPVQSVSAWRKQAKAEKGAGMPSTQSRVLIKSFTCNLCWIGIGRNHHEQELYLLPLVNQDIWVGDDVQPTHFDHALLYCCGGCARRRQLPESHLVVPASAWQEAFVLSTRDIQGAIAAFERDVLPSLWSITYEAVLAYLHPKKPGHAQAKKPRTHREEEKVPMTTSLLAAYHAQLPHFPTFTQIAI